MTTTDQLYAACLASGGHTPSNHRTQPRWVQIGQVAGDYLELPICSRCGVPVLPTQRPRPLTAAQRQQELADPAAVRAWIIDTGLSREALARTLGFKSAGWIYGAMASRPITVGRFAAWKEAYARATAVPAA